MSKVVYKFANQEEAVFESEESLAMFLEARNGAHSTSTPRVTTQQSGSGQRSSRPASPVKDAVLSALSTTEPQTTKQLTDAMKRAGYVFQAADPIIAVNTVLLALEGKKQAHVAGTAPNNSRQKLWLKGVKV